MLGGRFVEMTLRAGDSWSAVVYIGHERSQRRHMLVSFEPGDRRVTTRRGEWVRDRDRLLLTSDQLKATCDVMTPGELKLELAEQGASGQDFVRFKAEYRPAIVAANQAAPPRPHRRFVIA